MERTEPLPEGDSLEELAQKVDRLRSDFAEGKSSAKKRAAEVDGPTAPDRNAQDLDFDHARLVIAREHNAHSWEEAEKWFDLADHVKEAMDAITSGNSNRFAELLAEYPGLTEAVSHKGRPLIAEAAFSGSEVEEERFPGRLSIIRMLVDAGSDVNEGPDRALMCAATWNDVPATALLIESGALLDGVRDNKWILANALMFRKGDTAALMVENGASTDLAMAAGVGRMDLVEEKFDSHGALRAGERLFSGWWDGSPPTGLDLSETRFVLDFAFAVACAGHHFGIADFLLDRGAEIDGGARGFLDDDFSTVLHMAAFFGDEELVDFLLARGADPDLTDEIHQASACGHAEAGGNEALAARLRDASGHTNR